VPRQRLGLDARRDPPLPRDAESLVQALSARATDGPTGCPTRWGADSFDTLARPTRWGRTRFSTGIRAVRNCLRVERVSHNRPAAGHGHRRCKGPRLQVQVLPAERAGADRLADSPPVCAGELSRFLQGARRRAGTLPPVLPTLRGLSPGYAWINLGTGHTTPLAATGSPRHKASDVCPHPTGGAVSALGVRISDLQTDASSHLSAHVRERPVPNSPARWFGPLCTAHPAPGSAPWS
jgi:hypothetical protein